jgi:hypothetical protein
MIAFITAARLIGDQKPLWSLHEIATEPGTF